VLERRAKIRILFADTKDIKGQAFGQMILQLPEDEMLGDKIINYLKNKNVNVEELIGYVG